MSNGGSNNISIELYASGLTNGSVSEEGDVDHGKTITITFTLTAACTITK